MKQAYIFPGLNALLRRTDRLRYLGRPRVKKYLNHAEEIIGDHFHQRMSFLDFLEGSVEDIYSIQNISVAAVAICSIQTAVAEELAEKEGPPDFVMGCSLGDLARAVFARAYSFEDAVVNHIKFTQKIDGIDKIGRNIGVLAPKSQVFTDEDYQWFSDIAVDVSCLTPRFLNIGGRFQELEKVEERAKEKSWNTMKILEYPAHSRYILPYVECVREDFKSVTVRRPSIPMYSSFSAAPISDPVLIREEFLLSICKPIHWNQAVQAICRNDGVTRFVNIGPCRSLSGLMRDIPVVVECVEAESIIVENAASFRNREELLM